ncbi:glycosyltransferase [Acetobacter thailandicus]|uniref:glycosyltransferase n=1 Tax=Acetobacter thailandicus TaxID=1502842 RepID=UPI001BAD8617|nr:glycosyltransferase [Acetobacter thailandicus]
MKIHYLVTSLENGGAEFAMPPILQTLRRYGCEVQVTACEPRDMKAAARLDAAGIPYTVMFNRKCNKLIYTAAFIKKLRQDRPDVIWTSLSAATLVGQISGKVLGIPVVSWKHSATVKTYTYLLRRMTQLWIADSFEVDQFLQNKMSIPANKIVTWPLYYSDTSDHILSYWDGSRPLRLGSMGRLREQKNYALLIDAIYLFSQRRPDLISKLQVDIAGDGPLKEILSQKVKSYGLENIIIFKGYCENTPAFLKTLDIYIQPSVFEGMCLAAHEAMAMGLPVIATPVGELAFSITDHETGFLLTDNIENDIVKSLEEIFAQPELISQYGTKAREFVANKFSEHAFDLAGNNVVNHIRKMILNN